MFFVYANGKFIFLIFFLGEGGATKAYNNTFHAIRTIVGQEGAIKLYTGFVSLCTDILAMWCLNVMRAQVSPTSQWVWLCYQVTQGYDLRFWYAVCTRFYNV